MSKSQSKLVKIDQVREHSDVEFCRKVRADCIAITVSDFASLGQIEKVVGGDFSDICLRFDLQDIDQSDCVRMARDINPWGVDFEGHFTPTLAACDEIVALEHFSKWCSSVASVVDVVL